MSYLADFVKYLKTRTDAPPDFHIHAGLASLSAAVGTSVWCDGWDGRLYPCLWTVLIAPSGYGKSVPLNMSRSILQKAGMGDRVLPTAFSQEALYDQLKAKPTGVWYLQEFAAFLATLSREYNAGSMEWLTDVYDVPEEIRRALRRDTITLHSPFVAILGASSPAWFAEQYRASQLRGGFLARFVFCPSAVAGVAVDDPGPRNEGLEANLAEHLRTVAIQQGRADYSGIRGKLIEWEREARRQREQGPPEFSGMRSRMAALARKSTLLFMLSRDPETRQPIARDYDNATAYVEKAIADAERFLTEEVAHDREDAERLRVVELVKRAGGIAQWSATLKASHLSARNFRHAVDTLTQSDRMRVVTREGAKWLAVAGYVNSQNSQGIRGELGILGTEANGATVRKVVA